MTLSDPREALADQSDFIGYLVGLAGLARVVRILAAEADPTSEPPRDPGDFVHALLGLASIGAAIERVAYSVPAQRNAAEPSGTAPTMRWLR